MNQYEIEESEMIETKNIHDYKKIILMLHHYQSFLIANRVKK